jgi:hypothetical protein
MAEVDMFEVFDLGNKLMPIIAGRDLPVVAMAFSMILGRAEAGRKPFPQVAELQVVVSNEIARWAEPRATDEAAAQTAQAIIKARGKP